MKKFIQNIIVFIVFAALFYIVALFIWERYFPSLFKPNIYYRIGSPGHMYSRLSEVKKQENVDMLFLGSSHTYRGFDTRIFSQYKLKTFNLGSSSQSPIQTEVLLNRYLDNLNPKIVIYEVYPVTFMSDGVESSLDIIANDRNDLYSFEMTMEINNIKTYNTYLYGLLDDFFGINKSYSESAVKGDDTYISGGYVERQMGFFEEPDSFEKKEIKIDQVQLEKFTGIVSKLKDRNINVILVYAPIPESSYNSYTNNRYFDSIMESYAEYYNFNEIGSYNDSLHFYDDDHLNQKGVELFNARLIEILKQGESRMQNNN